MTTHDPGPWGARGLLGSARARSGRTGARSIAFHRAYCITHCITMHHTPRHPGRPAPDPAGRAAARARAAGRARAARDARVPHARVRVMSCDIMRCTRRSRSARPGPPGRERASERAGTQNSELGTRNSERAVMLRGGGYIAVFVPTTPDPPYCTTSSEPPSVGERASGNSEFACVISHHDIIMT